MHDMFICQIQRFLLPSRADNNQKTISVNSIDRVVRAACHCMCSKVCELRRCAFVYACRRRYFGLAELDSRTLAKRIMQKLPNTQYQHWITSHCGL